MSASIRAGRVRGRPSPLRRIRMDSGSRVVTPGSRILVSTRWWVARSNSTMGRTLPFQARRYTQRTTANHCSKPKLV
ncbi:hypothetical protein [Nonomuraea sp. H19]|uniref:hypothetical protein n=1 Tax=Nonomuraea sp. H19 TaxID=3452206 RepID=UPI003F8A5735